MTHLAIARTPGPELAECELTHLERAPIDAARALEQHASYVAALESVGATTRVLPPLDGHPDACFVEDPAVVLDDLAVLTRPGVASRLGEVASLGTVLAEVCPVVALERGSLEGGDVLRIEHTLYAGLSTRTDAAGIEELARHARAHGLRVESLRAPGALHLKTAVTWLGDDVLLANPAWIDLETLRGFRVIEVDPDEPFGANVLKVGEHLLASTAAPRTAERIAGLGLDAVPVDISEFHRAEAGLTCLSLVLRTGRG